MTKALLDHRVLFVTGKGGVGKTTISCALALCAARQGKRVLLVETGSKENMSFIFGTHAIGYDPVEVYPGVQAMFLDPYEALTEFLAHQIRIRMIAKTVVNNRVFRYLTEVAPGWRELITLGKVWITEQGTGKRGDRPHYDLIIVDSPATGHGLGLLRVPQVLLDTLAFGPIKHYTGKVQKLLADEERTRLCVVTLAEEMPVAETLELIQTVHDTVKVPMGPVFVNAVYPEIFAYGLKGRTKKLLQNSEAMALLEKALGGKITAGEIEGCAGSLAARRQLHERHIRVLTEKVGKGLLVLPYMFTEYFDVRDLEDLSAAIDEGLKESS